MPNTIWDVLDKDVAFTLSGGNLIATAGSSSNDLGVRAVDPHTTGTAYIELACDAVFTGGDTGVGFCANGRSWNELGNNAVEAVIVYANGNIWCNGSNLGINIGSLAGHVVCGVLDLPNNRAYLRRDGGNWNNNPSANPTTNTGGIDISAVTASAPWVPVFISTSSAGAGSKVTANFGDTTFAQSVPSGITSGWSAGAFTQGSAFDAGSTDPNITISNSGYTVSFNTGGADKGSLALPVLGSGSKVFFEYFVNAAGVSGNTGLGVAGTGATPGGVVSGPANAGILFATGSIYVNSSLVSSFHALGPLNSGHIPGVAIDTAADLYWTRKEGAGQWNDGGTANPATGVGGYPIGSGAIILPLGPAVTLGTGASQPTISLNSSSRSKTKPPAGFTVGIGLPAGGLALAGLTSAGGSGRGALALATGTASLMARGMAASIGLSGLTPAFALGGRTSGGGSGRGALFASNKLTATKILAYAVTGPQTGNISASSIRGYAITLNVPPGKLGMPKMVGYAVMRPLQLKLSATKLIGYAVTVPSVAPPPVFPTLPVGFPVTVKPGFATVAGEIPAGRSMRSPLQTLPVWEFEINYEELRDQTQNAAPYAPLAGFTQLMQLSQLFLASIGPFGRFLFDAWWDNSRLDQPIAAGDGVSGNFTMVRTWGYGDAQFTEPVGAVNAVTNVKIDGVVQDPATYFVQGNRTLTFLSAPADGTVITATFSYFYLCQFSGGQQDYQEFAKNRFSTKIQFRSVLQ